MMTTDTFTNNETPMPTFDDLCNNAYIAYCEGLNERLAQRKQQEKKARLERVIKYCIVPAVAGAIFFTFTKPQVDGLF